MSDHQHGVLHAARLCGGASTKQEIERYLPSNYATVVVESYPNVDPIDQERGVVLDTHGSPDRLSGQRVLLLIVGVDVAGWTLTDYVIPRLASGGIYAEPINMGVAHEAGLAGQLASERPQPQATA